LKFAKPTLKIKRKGEKEGIWHRKQDMHILHYMANLQNPRWNNKSVKPTFINILAYRTTPFVFIFWFKTKHLTHFAWILNQSYYYSFEMKILSRSLCLSFQLNYSSI
jgi:hypothetical protein